jgi:hypothetical protein
MNDRIFSFLRFICLAYLVLVIPKAISVWSDHKESTKGPSILLGIEHLVDATGPFKNLKRYRYALVCDKQSFDQDGNRTVDLLVKSGFSIKKIFVRGSQGDAAVKKVFIIRNEKDSATGIPVQFLRDDDSESIVKNSHGIEAFLVDITDDGITTSGVKDFLQTLFLDSYEKEKRVVVLDRPNLLGGIIEGPGEVPWRHGLTVGELAIYVNRYIVKTPASVTIVPMRGWRRENNSLDYQNTILSLLLPLKNMRPLFVSDNEHGLKVVFNDKDKLSRWEMTHLRRLCWQLGINCLDTGEGISLSLEKEVTYFSGLNSLLTISRFLKNRKQFELAFGDQFDNEIGSPDVREFLQNVCSFEEMKKNLEKSLVVFFDKSKYCCLYKPLPRVISPELIKA